MPNYVPKLKTYIRELSKRFSADEPLTYEAFGDRLGVSRTTVGNLMAGIASAREKIREMADRAGVPRSPFLDASGYKPTGEDLDHDHSHYPSEIIKHPEIYGLDAKTIHSLLVASGYHVELSHEEREDTGQSEVERLPGYLPVGNWEDGVMPDAFIMRATRRHEPFMDEGREYLVRRMPEGQRETRTTLYLIDGEIHCSDYARFSAIEDAFYLGSLFTIRSQ